MFAFAAPRQILIPRPLGLMHKKKPQRRRRHCCFYIDLAARYFNGQRHSKYKMTYKTFHSFTLQKHLEDIREEFGPWPDYNRGFGWKCDETRGRSGGCGHIISINNMNTATVTWLKVTILEGFSWEKNAQNSHQNIRFYHMVSTKIYSSCRNALLPAVSAQLNENRYATKGFTGRLLFSSKLGHSFFKPPPLFCKKSNRRPVE